jgi:heparan-alpha-glucosaminide N-acetyltransferase
MSSVPPPPGSSPPVPARLASLDAYRGAIMLLMASAGLGLTQVARGHPDSPVWQWVGRHCEHASWAGCTLWDLIQPAFMFMVGVALPWSLANRRSRGSSTASLFGHSLWRSLLLVLLAVFLTSAWSPRTEWIFPNVLAQIGLGYPFLFLIALTRPRTQAWTAAALLVGYGLLFALYPVPTAGVEPASPDTPLFTGWEAHWNKGTNAAAAFDRWFLNLFPRSEPFTRNEGGYQTLNFIPSLATMIFGVLAGQLLRSGLPMRTKVRRLVLAGVAGIVVGGLLGWTGTCPIVKRIWTPSWALYSGGWVTLILAGFVRVTGLLFVLRCPTVVRAMNGVQTFCLKNGV